MLYNRATNGTHFEVMVKGEWMEEAKALAAFGSDYFDDLEFEEVPDWATKIETAGNL